MIAAASPTLAAVGGTSMWYLTRGSGIVALLALTASVVLGVLTAGRWEARGWPRFVVEGLHRNVSLAVLVFLVIHIATTVVDGFVPLGWLDVVLPFRAGYRPLWVGLGALAFDCLLAVIITSLLRVRIGHRTWRNIHLLSYACWPIALVHGLGTGSDSAQPWMIALDAACVLGVVGVVLWRLAVRRPLHPASTPVALTLSAVVPLALALFAWTGPMQPGWSHHGARLLGSSAPSASANQAPAGFDALPVPLDVSVTGTRTVTERQGSRLVTLDVHSADAAAVVLRIDLAGIPDSSGGVVLNGGQVSLTRTGTPAAWQGPVLGLNGDTITAQVVDGAGRHARLTAQLSIDRTSETVTGTIHLRATRSNSATTATTSQRRGEGSGDRDREGGD